MAFAAALGTSDFRQLREDGLGYVDKTGFIGKVVRDPARVLVFPRPRRFGKTLNLSTLACFFDRTEEDVSSLFQDLEVWEDELARSHFGRHPVISMTFKDIKLPTWESSFARIRAAIARLYRTHRYLLDKGFLDPESAERFRQVLRGEGEEAFYSDVLEELSHLLARYHGERVIILVDEYDTPLHAAFTHGYYEQALSFFRHASTFDAAGKQPEKLYHGFILGLLVTLEKTHRVRSNRESGYGRADVLIIPRRPGEAGVVMALKVLGEGETVEHALRAALTQVCERRYRAEVEAAGAEPVHVYAVVFDGKRAWVRAG